MRIVVLTTNDFFSHFFLFRFIQAYRKNIIGIFVEPASVKKAGPVKIFFLIWRSSGWRYAFYGAAEAIWYTVILTVKRFFEISRVGDFRYAADVHEVPVERIHNANHPEFLEKLRRLQPDLLLLVRYNRIIRKAVVETPKIAALNIHVGLLPKYRGLAPTANAMMRGEKCAGASLHKVDSEIDRGGIIGSALVPIHYDESLLINQYRVILSASRLLIDLFRDILRTGKIAAAPQPPTGDYFHWPSREHVASFRKSGGKLLRFQDLFFLWRNL